jgi:hypothetical protein
LLKQLNSAIGVAIATHGHQGNPSSPPQAGVEKPPKAFFSDTVKAVGMTKGESDAAIFEKPSLTQSRRATVHTNWVEVAKR